MNSTLDEKGVSVVLGAILLLTIGALAFFTLYPTILSTMIRDKETSLVSEVDSSFGQLQAEIQRLAEIGGSERTVSFPMSPGSVPFAPTPRMADGLVITSARTRAEDLPTFLAIDENFSSLWNFNVVHSDVKGGPTSSLSSGTAKISSGVGRSLAGEGYFENSTNLYIWGPDNASVKFSYKIEENGTPNVLDLYLKLEDPDGIEVSLVERNLKWDSTNTWLSIDQPIFAFAEKKGFYGVMKLGISYITNDNMDNACVSVSFDNLRLELKKSIENVARYGTIEHEAQNLYIPSQTHVYETGAVIKVQDDTNLMFSDPSFLSIENVGKRYTVVQDILAIAGPADSTNRTSLTSIHISRKSSYTPGWLTKKANVKITIQSDYEGAWRTYLEKLKKLIGDNKDKGLLGLWAEVDPSKLEITIHADVDNGFWIYYGTMITIFEARIS